MKSGCSGLTRLFYLCGTMTTLPRPNWPLALGLPLLVMTICAILVCTPLFLHHEQRLSTAVILDLTVTAPLLYFLAIRKTRIPNMTVIRIFLLGVLLAGILLDRHNPFLHGIKTWVSPMIEVFVVFIIARKFYQARKANADEADFLTQARAIASHIFGNARAGDILGSEFAVFYYAFAPTASPSPGSFSYSRSAGTIPVISAFLICMVAEGIGLHFLIARWSPLTAWILTGLSAYTMLQLIAHMRATKARPIRLENDRLILRNGLAADAVIDLSNIEEITLTTRTSSKENALKLALLGPLENHSVRIKLRQPVTVTRMFGIRRVASVLLFAVDRSAELFAAIDVPPAPNVPLPPSP